MSEPNYRSTEEILKLLTDLIGWCYERPDMYGGPTADRVDGVLYWWHQTWTFCVNRDADFTMALSAACSNSMGAAFVHRRDNPTTTEEETIAVVVDYWRRVDEFLGLKPTGTRKPPGIGMTEGKMQYRAPSPPNP